MTKEEKIKKEQRLQEVITLLRNAKDFSIKKITDLQFEQIHLMRDLKLLKLY